MKNVLVVSGHSDLNNSVANKKIKIFSYNKNYRKVWYNDSEEEINER